MRKIISTNNDEKLKTMKTKILSLILMILFVACGQKIKSKQAENQSIATIDSAENSSFEIEKDLEESKEIKFIRDFYTKYIEYCYSVIDDRSFSEKINSLLNKCVSENVLKKWDVEYDSEGEPISILDADPILNAQDCHISTIKTLTIKKIGNTNTYTVCYVWFDTDTICINVSLIENGDSFLIDDVN